MLEYPELGMEAIWKIEVRERERGRTGEGEGERVLFIGTQFSNLSPQ